VSQPSTHARELLEALDVVERLTLALRLQQERLAELRVRKRIRDDVETGAQKQQREYFLRRQMDAIRKELGENEASVAEEYRRKIAAAAMPVVAVSVAAVEALLLTEHCEMWHLLPVVIPAEGVIALVLARAEQPMRTQPEVTEMPATPPFDSALQLARVPPFAPVMPVPTLPKALQLVRVKLSPRKNPTMLLDVAEQLVRVEPVDATMPWKPLLKAVQLFSVAADEKVKPLPVLSEAEQFFKLHPDVPKIP
jgi:hypothetical protein